MEYTNTANVDFIPWSMNLPLFARTLVKRLPGACAVSGEIIKREILAEWFRPLVMFNSVAPGSNPPCPQSWSCFSVVRVQLLGHACREPTNLLPASWGSNVLFSACHIPQDIYLVYTASQAYGFKPIPCINKGYLYLFELTS